jgi:hypothetical protein
MGNQYRDKMINTLNELVVPVLRQLSFKGSFPHFRRLSADRLNLLTFQFDKYGGGFVIEIANCKPEGYRTSWGKEIKPDKLTVHDLNIRKRIQSNIEASGSSTDDWFRYDKKPLTETGDIYQEICKDVLSKLNIAEEFWNIGELNY